MADFRLEAETRTEFGKGSARRDRRAGRVPAVLYGHGQDVVHLSLPAREFAAALRNGGTNALLTIVLEGKEQLALTKAVQRDPLTRVHKHADLLLVRRGEKTTVDVPIVIVGEVAPDTIPNHQLSTVQIEADATKLPDSIEADVTGRSAGQNITAGDLVLPRGATLITDPEALVIGFLGAPTAEQLEAELEEAEAEAGIEREESDEAKAEETDAAEDAVPSEAGPARTTSPERYPLSESTTRGGAGTAGAPAAASPDGRVSSKDGPEHVVSEGPFLVVGLGNPGPGYAGNRHNVGAMVLDQLAAKAGIRLTPGKGARSRAVSGEGRLAGRRVVLARPLTYMNESGGPVRGLLDYHSLRPENLVVVHDELDISFGVIRLKRGGGEGGHNGLRSITRTTGTKDYLRVRVGIGRPPGRQDPADFVLKDFSGTERKELDLLLAEAVDATEQLLELGLDLAQNRVHVRD